MPTSPRLALMRLLILALSLPPMAGCVATRLTPPILAALDCASLIPPSYRRPIPSAGLLDPTETAGGLVVRYDRQTANLDQANGRTGDVIALADACQARQAAILTTLNPPPWWRRIHTRKAPPS